MTPITQTSIVRDAEELGVDAWRRALPTPNHYIRKASKVVEAVREYVALYHDTTRAGLGPVVDALTNLDSSIPPK